MIFMLDVRCFLSIIDACLVKWVYAGKDAASCVFLCLDRIVFHVNGTVDKFVQLHTFHCHHFIPGSARERNAT